MKLKRMTSQEVPIGEEVFHVRPLAAMDSAQVFGDVTSVILPIAGVVAISSGDEEERKSSVELDMFKGFNLDTESLMTALGKIDGRQVTRLMSELLLEHSNVSFLDTDQSPAVWRPMLKADFDELFCMDLLGAFRLCLAVIKQNYSNFFSDMSTLFGGHVKVSKEAQSKTTENSTESA
jgi:hypothetical protein